MTTNDLVERYKSDLTAVRRMFDENKIDIIAFESEIVRIDNSLFGSLGFMPTVEVATAVEDNELDTIIDNIKGIA